MSEIENGMGKRESDKGKQAIDGDRRPATAREEQKGRAYFRCPRDRVLVRCRHPQSRWRPSSTSLGCQIRGIARATRRDRSDYLRLAAAAAARLEKNESIVSIRAFAFASGSFCSDCMLRGIDDAR